MRELIEQLSERLNSAVELLKGEPRARRPTLKTLKSPEASAKDVREANRELARQAEETLNKLEAIMSAASSLSQQIIAGTAPSEEAVRPEDLAGHFRSVVDNAQRDARLQASGEVGVSLRTMDIEVKGLIVVEQDEARLVTPTLARGLDAAQLSTIRMKFGAVPTLRPSDLEPLSVADLAIRKTGEVTNAPPDSNWTVKFSIEVENKGPAEAVNVFVNDEPDATNFVRAFEFETSQGKWVLTSPPKFEAQLGNLKAGQRVILSYVAEVRPFSILKTVASARSDTIDPQPENNSFTLEMPAPFSEKRADLAIKKIGLCSPPTARNMVNYTITVINNGPADAENVVVIDLPDREATQAVSHFTSDPRGRWTQTRLPRLQADLGTMKAGESITLKYRAKLRHDAKRALNKAEVSSSTADPTPANNTDSFLINLT